MRSFRLCVQYLTTPTVCAVNTLKRFNAIIEYKTLQTNIYVTKDKK
jgi:hypothetical protein